MAQLLESVDHHGLEELSIWNDLNDNNIPPPAIDLSHLIPPGKTIFLPQLTYFSLHTYCTYTTVDLFKYLSLPSLTTFCIAQWTSDIDFTVFTQLLMFLARNARNLRVLELGPDCEPRDPFDEHQMHFWGLLQSVECLRLRTEVRATVTFIASLCRYNNAQRSSDFSTPTSEADPATVRLKELTLSIDSQTVEEEIGSLHLLVDALVLLIPARTTTTSETHTALQPAASFDDPPFKLLLRIGEGKNWMAATESPRDLEELVQDLAPKLREVFGHLVERCRVEISYEFHEFSLIWKEVPREGGLWIRDRFGRVISAIERAEDYVTLR